MNRNAFRYSIATMLFVCFVVAGTCAGFRAGFSEGYAAGNAKRQAEEPFAKVYEIGDLMRSASNHDDASAAGEPLNIDSLVAAAQMMVHPDEWELAGGPGTIRTLPWLESIAVHATSDAHRGLELFFADVASVKLAVAAGEKEHESMRRAGEARVTRALEPAESSLGVPLEPIAASVNLVGTWEVRPASVAGHTQPVRYTFIDHDTVTLTSLDGAQPTETWYVSSPASVVIAGKGYAAAWDADRNFVLIEHDAPDTFLIATRIGDE